MKGIKPSRIITLVLCFTLVMSGFSLAQEQSDKQQTVLQPSANPVVTIIVDGEELKFPVSPVIEQDRILVPIRSLAEQLGAKVDWQASENKVIVNNNIELTIGEKIAYVDGEKAELEVPARINENYTFVPLRFISESLHAEVTWLPAERKVLIESDEENKPVEANIRINDFIYSPEKLTVTGTARVWEANVLYEVTDKNDKVLFDGFTTASVGAPLWGDFSISIDGDLGEAYVVRIFTESAKDGSRMDIVEYFLEPFGTGKILSQETNSILVEGVFGGYTDQPVQFYFAITPETIITDANHHRISESELKPGDELEIWISYPGLVLESWPAQAGAGKIVKKNASGA
jgi:hypothetical protein